MSTQPAAPAFDRTDAARQIAEAAHALARAKANLNTAADTAKRANARLLDLQQSYAPRLLDTDTHRGLLVVGDSALLIDLDRSQDPAEWVTVMPAERLDATRDEAANTDQTPNLASRVTLTLMASPSATTQQHDGLQWRASLALGIEPDDGYEHWHTNPLTALRDLLDDITKATGHERLSNEPLNVAARDLCMQAIGHVYTYSAQVGTHTWTREVAA